MSDHSAQVSGRTADNPPQDEGHVPATGSGTPTLAEAPADTELANLVADLATAISSLQDDLPHEKATEGEVMASILEAEMDKSEPDRERIRRWLDRIQVWADDIDEQADPVRNLAAAVNDTLAG